jgi:hypothetical protein
MHFSSKFLAFSPQSNIALSIGLLIFLQVYFPFAPEACNHRIQPLNLIIEVVSFCPFRAHTLASGKMQNKT